MALIEFKNLPDTTTPLTAENLNKIQEGNIYSTNEIEIGEWINGKPLYRKVIDCGNLPNASTKDVASNLTNVMVVNIHGFAYNPNTGNSLPLPYAVTTSTGAVAISFNSNNVRLVTNSDRSTWNAYVILEYTKTTN